MRNYNLWLANFCLNCCLGGLGCGCIVIDHSNRQILKLLGLSQWRQLIFTKHLAMLLLNFILAVTNGMNLFVWKFTPSQWQIQSKLRYLSFKMAFDTENNFVLYEFILHLRTPYLHMRLATKAWNSSDSFYFLIFNLCYFGEHHSFKQFFFNTSQGNSHEILPGIIVWSELCIMAE